MYYVSPKSNFLLFSLFNYFLLCIKLKLRKGINKIKCIKKRLQPISHRLQSSLVFTQNLLTLVFKKKSVVVIISSVNFQLCSIILNRFIGNRICVKSFRCILPNKYNMECTLFHHAVKVSFSFANG